MGLLAAPLIIAFLSGFLATVIAIVDGIVNNYGEVEIDINNGKKKLKVKGGSSLLSTLASEKIFIPSACGGRGSCGACKIIVLSDVGPLLPTELPFLSEEERKDKIRLACQIKLKKSIKVQVPAELFGKNKFSSILIGIKDLTYDIKELKIQLKDPKTLSFKAGQYVQLVIPPYGQTNSETQRAYSISSKPSETNTVELLVRLVPGGLATTYVHNFAKIEERINVVGPFGDFYVRDTEASLICVAGGSGMAPIKSIIFDLFERKSKREIWYFFGAKSLKDLYYLDIFAELEKEMPTLHFIPALSAPLPEDGWKGEKGLITDVLDRFLKGRIPADSPKEGYLCGSPGMINACVQVMTDNGISKEKIYFDKF